MTHSQSEPHRVSRADFPRLAEFARGYLHQDLIPEHGSALNAAKAYRADLPAGERKTVAAEAFRFRKLTQEWMSSELNSAIAELGGAWTFVSRDELEPVLQTLEGGH